ncbi:MAG: GAF domain-containing protein [Chloroflexota bacterium]
MTAKLSRIRILSWPLWLKLAVAFTIAIVVPLVMVVVAAQPGLREISIQNLRSYISENGERQRAAVANSIAQARGNLTAFLNNSTHQRRIVNLLLSNSPLLNRDGVEAVTREQIETLFTSTLLVQSTTLYDSVRLLDRNGQLLANATINEAAGTLETDQSRSEAYRAALNEQVKNQGQSQVVSVSSRDGRPVVEITNIVYWRDGRPIGYLIAELNIERTLLDNLTYLDAAFPAYSYLLSNNRVLISLPAAQIDEEVAAGSQAARRALSGEVGLDAYRPAPNLPEVIGYFAPVSNAPLAIVSEVPTDYATAVTQGFFDIRLFSISLASVALAIVLAFLLYQMHAPALGRLRAVTDDIADGNFDTPIADMARGDEIGQLAMSLSVMRSRVQSLIHDLEARVAIRTRDIEATYDISRVVVSQRDLSTLLDRAVNLIVERFPIIYHAQIFLLDSERAYAHLRASTGEAGRQLLARGHRLAVGSVSVIGQVTEQGRVVIARDTTTSDIHRHNEFLPDTRAELAIPLRIGDEVIGALDVQSKQREAFDDDLVSVLQTMADQIALAIQNARLYQEWTTQLEAVERNNRAATRAVWQDYMRGLRASSTQSVAGTPATDASALQNEALSTGRIAIGQTDERGLTPIAVPVILRGEILGAVVWEIPQRLLDDNRLLLAQELANRLAISLDNARLFEESQRATERERIVNMIAAKVTAQTDIDEILQTAVREVGQALHAPQVSIRLRQAVEKSEVIQPRLESAHAGKDSRNNGNGRHA